ncbi:MAG: hypothetical protein AAB962_01110, partial [Patescibacteria group bacterium]
SGCPDSCFQDRCIRPLCHLSNIATLLYPFFRLFSSVKIKTGGEASFIKIKMRLIALDVSASFFDISSF